MSIVYHGCSPVTRHHKNVSWDMEIWRHTYEVKWVVSPGWHVVSSSNVWINDPSSFYSRIAITMKAENFSNFFPQFNKSRHLVRELGSKKYLSLLFGYIRHILPCLCKMKINTLNSDWNSTKLYNPGNLLRQRFNL